MKEWAGTGSIIHNPTGLFLWTAFSNSEDGDKGAVGWLTGRKPPEMHAWDVAGGIHRSMIDLGKTTIWGGYTEDHNGLGGFTRNSGSPSRTVWDGKLDAFNPITRSGRFIPGVDVPSEVTGAETTNGTSPSIRRSIRRPWISVWLTNISSRRSISCHASIGMESFPKPES